MLTVADLIEQLSKLPPNSPVYAEGCDCVNQVRAAASLDHGCILVAEPDFHGILRFQQDRQQATQLWEQSSDQRPQATWHSLSPDRPQWIEDKTPLAVRLEDGAELPLASWPQLLAETVNWLLEQGNLRKDQLPVVYGKSCIAYEIGKPPAVNRPYRSQRIAGGAIAVNSGLSNMGCYFNAGKLLYHFGSEPSTASLLVPD